MSLCVLLSYPLESLSLDHANNALHPGGGVQSDIKVEAGYVISLFVFTQPYAQVFPPPTSSLVPEVRSCQFSLCGQFLPSPLLQLDN